MSDTVTIPAAQFQQLQSRLAGLEMNQAAEASARQAAESKALIAQGQSEAVIKQFQGKLAAAEDEAKTNAATADLRKALAAHPLRDGHAAEHVALLLADEITADRESSGRLVTRSKDFRPIEALVAERLSGPEYAHFLDPSRKHAANAAQPPPGNPTPALRPVPEDDANASLGVRVMNQALRAMEAKKADAATNDPRTTMGVSFGLGRKR